MAYTTAEQLLIDYLATVLADDALPTAKKKFTEAQLFTFITLALGDLNTSPPITSWTIESIDANFGVALVLGAIIWAMLNLNIFEIGREFSYNIKGTGVNFERSGKYAGVLQLIWTLWQHWLGKKFHMNAGTVFPSPGKGFSERMRGGSYGLQGLLNLLPGFSDRKAGGI